MEDIQETLASLSQMMAPNTFCLKCLEYLKLAHPTLVLQAVEKVLRSQIEDISSSTARKVIAVAARLMGSDANMPLDTKQAASDVLVAVGCGFPGEVLQTMDCVIDEDVQPETMWLNTLAHLLRANGSGTMPHLEKTLTGLLPKLDAAKTVEMHSVEAHSRAQLQMALCSVLTSACTSLQEYVSGPGGSADPTVKKQDFAPVIDSAFKTILKGWLVLEGRNLQSLRLQETLVGALAAMSPLLSPETLQANVTQLVAASVEVYKHSSNGEALGQNVQQILLAALEPGFTVYHVAIYSSVDSLLRALHQEICARQETRPPVDEDNAVLSSLTLLANAFPKKVAKFIVGQLKSSSEPGRAGSAAMLAHLLRAAGKADSLAPRGPGKPSFYGPSSTIFCKILEAIRAQLKEQVPEILHAVQPCLPHLTDRQLRVVAHIVSQCPEELTKALLNEALPLDRSSRVLWRALGSESKMSRRLLAFLMRKLPRDPAEDCVSAARRTLAVTTAMQELLAVAGRTGAFQRVFPRLFGALLLHTDCREEIPQEAGTPSQDTPREPSISREIVLALKALLARAKLRKATDQLKQEAAWAKLQSPDSHPEGVRLLARAMVEHAGPQLPGIMEVLVPSLSSDREQHRVTATAFFSEVSMWLRAALTAPRSAVLQLLGGSEKPLLKSLKRRAQDPCVRVRLLLFQGIERSTAAQVTEHGRELLAILRSGLQDTDVADRQAVLAALSALSHVLPHLRRHSVSRDVAADVLRRITALWEKDDAELHCACATVLGNLCRCPAVTAHLKRELQVALVQLALHLRDPNPEVTQACLWTLNNSIWVLDLNIVRTLISRNQDRGALFVDGFLEDLAAFLASDFPEALGGAFSCVLDCLNSRSPAVRANAAVFTESLINKNLLGRRQWQEVVRALTRAKQEESDALAKSCTAQALENCSASQCQSAATQPVWKRLFSPQGDGRRLGRTLPSEMNDCVPEPPLANEVP
ncbi:maestro heat-like repeat-containing protein family member 7 [Amia ocellicauda]|uniref:maestro heat-like repeat-containing protein family member 7 n=1 Tax=Amia ocellicauda TaxID=2972642 RepID=UPI003463E575